MLVGAIALWLAAAFGYRYYVVRRGSTSVILRRLPAAAGAGWRHGVIVYGDSGVRYYRLSSLRMFADLNLRRSRLELGGRRTPVGTELEIMSRSMPIVAVEGDGLRVEIALERESMTAFQSWVESRPPERSLRRTSRRHR
ncbi:DUF2550 domain-containing protein [Tomitella cavernea]|uniref:DUF2550 domain-containing protein n=1 Tax=Tomitella cavernea TaxID=1387982 RepID=UPI0027DCCDC4|nr:DUF2550 domain-containing protein [Tomitella cavernea]